ncbi:hypothetical protein [Halococcus sp. PRR34]|uniref:hypothetical protein n=1 Tax=Halococcus sp. PRR34 TaxID=3020830 RepID=UPI00235DED4C|nr:hypothetical protein [Halococcus sp. PRR34]
MSVTIADVQNRVASLKQGAYRKAPVPAVLASWSFVGLERLGEKATSTRKRRMSLLSVGLMMTFVGPAAAQEVSCGSGPLSFLSRIHSLITQGAGTIIVSMVIVAGVLKMIPMRGTNSWGNALVGSVIVGVLFLVLGPALVDLADQSTDAVSLDAQCTGGGGGNSSG